MKKILLLTLMAFLGTATVRGQTTPNVPQLITQMQDPSWTVRAAAFLALEHVGFSTSDQLKLAVIDLLHTENLNTTNPGSEEYGEYYGDVIGAVVQLNDPRSIGALAGAIDTGNMAMNAIASFGTAALNQVVQQLSNIDPIVRMSAALTIGKMITANLVGDSNSQALIQSALNIALSDSDHYVQLAATGSLLKLSGNTSSITSVRLKVEQNQLVTVIE